MPRTDQKTKKKIKRGTKPPEKKEKSKKGRMGFQPGFSGNPAGRPKLTPEIKAVKEATYKDLHETWDWARNCKLTKTTIHSLLQNGSSREIDLREMNLLERGIFVATLKFSATGDFNHIRFILDHVIGKPKESLEIDAPRGNILVISSEFIPVIPGYDGNRKQNNSSEPTQPESCRVLQVD